MISPHKILASVNKIRLRKTNFAIISNNCWGAEFYKYYEREFQTPFIGLFMYPEDYLRLLSDFNNVMRRPLRFLDTSTRRSADYPIGSLGDGIEIFFMHYHNREEALEKWTRRTARMLSDVPAEDYYFKICDRDGLTTEQLDQFYSMPFDNKISFSNQPGSHKGHFCMFDETPDGLSLFWQTVNKVDYTAWLNRGVTKKYFFAK